MSAFPFELWNPPIELELIEGLAWRREGHSPAQSLSLTPGRSPLIDGCRRLRFKPPPFSPPLCQVSGPQRVARRLSASSTARRCMCRHKHGARNSGKCSKARQSNNPQVLAQDHCPFRWPRHPQVHKRQVYPGEQIPSRNTLYPIKLVKKRYPGKRVALNTAFKVFKVKFEASSSLQYRCIKSSLGTTPIRVLHVPCSKVNNHPSPDKEYTKNIQRRDKVQGRGTARQEPFLNRDKCHTHLR
ncbi:hypothetical protein C8F04DRAFT_1182855 [Mycena alexandri]|uniref:Uncharacterized protein n=1 Tax=Mycena alexandri TaxID=1745969 RepID=A0AAD6X0Z4_9AGAR|nr:hypothetical protein C8F04DRAFT_1182855 [Mycena alexandri]